MTATQTLPARPSAQPSVHRTSVWQRLTRKLVLRKLAGLQSGRLQLWDNATGRQHTFGTATAEVDAMDVQVQVHSPAFYTAMARRGTVGAAESYMDGLWTCADPAQAVRLLLRNREVLQGINGGLARLSLPIRQLLHRRRRNNKRGSHHNIAAHYDLGNDFFATFLDSTMTYSSGIFERAEMSLQESQVAKLDRLCRVLDLQPSDHLVEIGTGWGSLAMHAASEYGCRVTTTTISAEQFALARQRVEQAGLADRVTVLQQDYRDLQGRYDKLVSVEMIEAVGHHYLETYLQKCNALLVDGGRMALQAITIADQHYEQALRGVDFIKSYIFPGSFIPSLTAILTAMTRATSLRMLQQQDFGPSYAETLRRWRSNCSDQRDAITALGYPTDFQRMWEFYLAYCEGGFDEGMLGVSQLVFEN